MLLETQQAQAVQDLKRVGFLLDGYEHTAIPMDAERYRKLTQGAAVLIEQVGDTAEGAAVILGYASLRELVYPVRGAATDTRALMSRLGVGKR